MLTTSSSSAASADDPSTFGLGLRLTGDPVPEPPASPFVVVVVGRAIGVGRVIGPGLLVVSRGTDPRLPAPGASMGEGSDVDGVGASGVLGFDGGPMGELFTLSPTP